MLPGYRPGARRAGAGAAAGTGTRVAEGPGPGAAVVPGWGRGRELRGAGSGAAVVPVPGAAAGPGSGAALGRVLRERVQRLRREGLWVHLSMPASRSRLCCPRASETRRSGLALLAGPKGAPTEGTCEGGECGGGEGSGGEGERRCHGVVKVQGPRGLPRGARQMRSSRRRALMDSSMAAPT